MDFSEDHATSMMLEVQESQGSNKMETYLPIEVSKIEYASLLISSLVIVTSIILWLVGRERSFNELGNM